MNKIIIVTFLFINSLNIFSQSKKISVDIVSFTSNSVEDNYVESIEGEVTKSFVSTKRFNIVDHSKMAALKREKELQKSEDFIDGKVVQQGKNLGAEYLITGHVNYVKAEESTTNISKANIIKKVEQAVEQNALLNS